MTESSRYRERAFVFVGVTVAIGWFAAAGCSDPYASNADPAEAEEAGVDAGAVDAATVDVSDAAPDAARSLRVIYARGFGGPPGLGADAGSVSMGAAGLSVDPTGSLWATGSFTAPSVDFGGGALALSGTADAFVVNLDATGGHLFSKQFGDAQEQYGIAVASSGSSAYVGLAFKGTVDFGGGTVTNTGTFNSAIGRLQPGYAGQEPIRGNVSVIRSLVPNSAGGAWALGNWSTDVDIVGKQKQIPSTGSQIFLARLFPLTPQVPDVRFFGDPGNAIVGSAAAPSTSGDVVITGRFSGGVDFGDAGTLTATNNNAFVARMDGTLAPRWTRVLGGAGIQEGHGIAAVPGTSDVVVVGTFEGELAAPGRSTVPTRGAEDVFVVRLDGTGNIVWLSTFGGAGEDRPGGVHVDTNGNVFVCGLFRSPTIDFGGGPVSNADPSGRNTSDAFVLWLDAAGKYVTAERYGDGEDQVASGVGIDATGDIVVGGTFAGAMKIGNTQLDAGGVNNMWLAKLGR